MLDFTMAETLGVWPCPLGDEDGQLQKILDRCKKWTSCTSAGCLPTKYALVPYQLKLLPAIWYGLATMATKFKFADKLISGLEYWMLSFLGVNSHIKNQ